MMWKDSYRLGVDSIDAQHRELFRMTEELVRAVKENASTASYEKALRFLKDYVIYHFRDEEAYQASIQYSGIEAHKAEHRQFTQTVLGYEKQLQENGFQRQTMQDLVGTVTVWLIYHVVDTDQKMVTRPEQDGQAQRFTRSLDVFAGSALDVLETMAKLDKAQTCQQAESPYRPQSDLLVSLDVIGDLHGTVLLGFSTQLALHLIQSMTMMELTEADAFVQSALCELTNIACGNAVSALVSYGLHCDIKPPQAVQSLSSGIPGTGLRIDTPFGQMEVGLLTEDPAGQLL